MPNEYLSGREAATLLLMRLGISTKDVSEVTLKLHPSDLCAVQITRLVQRSEISAFYDQIATTYSLVRNKEKNNATD